MKNIVLIDFTPESIQTLKYAINFVKPFSGSLELVNVSKETDFETSKQKLTEIQSEYQTSDTSIEIKELKGDLVTDLPAYINHDKIGFVFCGTHDTPFLSSLFSSDVVKLMNKLSANFIFVPRSVNETNKIKHVLMPVLKERHSLESLEVLIFLKHFMKFDITLCTYDGGHDEHNKNMFMATKILNNANVAYKVKALGSSEKELLNQLGDYANEINAEAIAIVNMTETHIFNFGAKGFMEELIRNKNGVSVITVQNQKLETYSSFQATGG